MLSYIKKLIGTSHDRTVRKMRPRVARINDLVESGRKFEDLNNA